MQTTHTYKKTGLSQCDIILDALLSNHGQWVSMLHLHEVSGSMAVHSRIADLRKAGHQIEHKNQQVGRMIHSSYRILTTETQPELF